MKTDLQVLKPEPSVVKAVTARAENVVKAAKREIRQAQLAHLQRLAVAKSRTGHRGVVLP